MINNTQPGFRPNGGAVATGTHVPPSNVRTIGDALNEKRICVIS